jgi:hypothetical protein
MWAGCLLLLAQQGVYRHMLQRPPQPPQRLKTYHTLCTGIGLQVSNSNKHQGQLQIGTGWLANSCSLACVTGLCTQHLVTELITLQTYASICNMFRMAQQFVFM